SAAPLHGRQGPVDPGQEVIFPSPAFGAAGPPGTPAFPPGGRFGECEPFLALVPGGIFYKKFLDSTVFPFFFRPVSVIIETAGRGAVAPRPFIPKEVPS